MKYILIFLFAISCMGFTTAQTKGFHFAIKAVPTLNWFWGGKTEMMKAKGNVIGFTGGVEIIKSYTNISLQSGLFYEITGGSVKYTNYGEVTQGNSNELHISYFYSTTGNEILDNRSAALNRQFLSSGSYPNLRYYQLDERNYYIHYLTIPLLIKFNNKLPFGYSGVAGINSSFLLNAYANDKVTSIDENYMGDYLGATDVLKHLKIKKEIEPLLFKLNLGVTKNIAITKNIYFCYGISYLLGITKPLQEKSYQLRYRKFDVSSQYVEGAPLQQNLNINSLELNLELVW